MNIEVSNIEQSMRVNIIDYVEFCDYLLALEFIRGNGCYAVRKYSLNEDDTLKVGEAKFFDLKPYAIIEFKKQTRSYTMNQAIVNELEDYKQFFVRDFVGIDVYVRTTRLTNFDSIFAINNNLTAHLDFWGCGCPHKLYIISRYNLNLTGDYTNDKITISAKTYKEALETIKRVYEESKDDYRHNYRVLTGRVYCIKKPNSADYPLDKPIPIMNEDIALDLYCENEVDSFREESNYSYQSLID